MAAREEKVRCETPSKGKGAKQIPRWKYDLLRTAIRRVIPRNAAGVEFQKLFELVRSELTPEQLQKLGSLPWYTTTVKLHLEVIGELERVPDSQPQRLRRVK